MKDIPYVGNSHVGGTIKFETFRCYLSQSAFCSNKLLPLFELANCIFCKLVLPQSELRAIEN